MTVFPMVAHKQNYIYFLTSLFKILIVDMCICKQTALGSAYAYSHYVPCRIYHLKLFQIENGKVKSVQVVQVRRLILKFTVRTCLKVCFKAASNNLRVYYKIITVDSRYLDFGYLEQPLISKRKSGPCLNLTSANKILWIRGEIAPQEQFLSFPTIFSIYISN